MKYRVEGVAVMPVKIQIEVHARNVAEALRIAAIKFETVRAARASFIVPNSECQSSVYDFEAHDAIEVPTAKAHE